MLDIPIKHVHELGKCNKAMVSKYRQHQAVNISNDDKDDDDDDLLDDDLNDDDSVEDSSEENSDPRWDELKKLKK